MKLSNLFPTTKEGIQALTLEEYISYLKKDESIRFINEFNEGRDTWGNAFEMINKAHEFLTQEFREDMLIGENRLFAGAGDWKKKGENILIKTNPGIWCCINIYDDGNLNDFIRESNKQKIKLYFNDIEI